jgi:cytochrome P450
LDWGSAAFDTLGPLNERCGVAMTTARGLIDYAMSLDPSTLSPDGWAAHIFKAAEHGEITPEQARILMLDYIGPSLDTTIFATTNTLWLLASHPDQWALLRQDPSWIPAAINESLRLESPIQIFSRYVTRDVEVDGVQLPAGSRAMILYGSANRDERKWTEPERFDIRRKAGDHLAFGHGEHMCLGILLARLEIRALLTALARRAERIELHGMERGLNNTLRGIGRLELSVH